jgi:hypothetical protein
MMKCQNRWAFCLSREMKNIEQVGLGTLTKVRSGWLGIACALALYLVVPQLSVAQSASGNTPSKKTGPSKTSTAKKSSKPSSNSSNSGVSAKPKTPPAKTHSSHASTATHPKSGTVAHGKSGSTNSISGHKSKLKNAKHKTVPRGQQKIDPDRALAIQEALIRVHYLEGEPAASWNQSSEDAMRRYQEDHGWQSKVVPDSRALIALGLGPNHEHLLNPDTAMTTEPGTPASAPIAPTSHSAEPGNIPAAGAKTDAVPSGPPQASGPNHNDANPQ